MRTLLVIFVSFYVAGHVRGQGRVAPGVPPQHYQQQQYQQPQFQQVPVQQQQQQQQQQMHVQYQQNPPQHQQVPVQQVHVPVQQQQPPPPQQQHHQQQGGHHHHGAPQPGQILNAANIMQEKEHIAEHLEVPIDTSKMTDQELQFHYFKMHDADNNNKLDGCELIKSLIHWHETDDGTKTAFSDEELSQLIDPLIKSFDENNDGFVDYTEFKKNS